MARSIIENPSACTLVHAMNILGGKWKLIILYQLANGSLRFGRLMIFVPSISKKVLTDQLRELEKDGLIIRTKYNEIPPRVEYKLSDKGKSLLPVLRNLSDWVVKTHPEIGFEECRIN